MTDDKYEFFLKDKIDGFQGNLKQWEQETKLKKTKQEKVNEITEEMCDNYCWHRDKFDTEAQLHDICMNCPLNRLEELVCD